MTIIDTATVEVSTPKAKRSRPSASVLAALSLLVRRRLWRDRGLLIASALIVALSTLLAYAGPQLVLNTIDSGAQDAVTSAGPRADIQFGFPVGNVGGDNLNSLPGTGPAGFPEQASTIADNLPAPVVGQVVERHAWVISPQIPIERYVSASERADAEEEERDPEFRGRLGDYLQLAFADAAGVSVVEGRAPVDHRPGENVSRFDNLNDVDEDALPSDATIDVNPDGTVVVTVPARFEVAMTEPVLEMLELDLGDLISMRSALGIIFELEIVGVVELDDPQAGIWKHLPEVSNPAFADNPALPLFRRGTVLVSPPTLSTLTSYISTPFPGTVYFTMGSQGLTLDNSRTLSAAIAELRTSTGDLMPEERVAVTVDTGLDAALDEYPSRARAALAQMSVVVAGVIAVAAVVIALMARLLLSRRESDISLERARGASIPSMALRLLIESAIFTAVGFAAGYLAAVALVGDLPLDNSTAMVVVVVAVLASPLLGTFMARRTWTGRREAANRQDRAKVRKAKNARRVTLELLILVLGALAVITLRGRGVLQTQTEGIDPFLAAAPVIVALAATIVVIRLYPLPMAIIQFLAKRTRGVSGVITLAKAREKIPALPLLALTLAIAVAVSGGLLVGTVQSGQTQAAWERVGGEVRVDSPVDEVTSASLEEEGLLVSHMLARENTGFALGRAYPNVHLIAIDDAYPDTLDRAGVTDPQELRDLLALDSARAEGDPIPVLASQEFIDIDFDGRSEIYVGRTYIPVDIVGLATVVPEGWTDGPYVIAPLDSVLATEVDAPVEPNITFVSGPGAAQAVADNTAIAPATVLTREGWLSGVRDSALIGGVERMMIIAVVAVAVLAAVALLVTVLQGMRERGRALSMLRTQGMRNGYGWWLALTELAPLTLAAVAGGAGAGLLILLLLGDTLGLEILAGGIEAPPLDANVEFLGAVAIGVVVLLFVAIAVEVATHRRHKLSEVLRYGESR